MALTLVEVFFMHNPLDYGQSSGVSEFRIIVMLVSIAFCWFGPLVLIVSWNAIVFTFLLRVIHHGYEKKKPPEVCRNNLLIQS